MLHVEIGVSIKNGQIVLPAGLPGYETFDPAQDPIPADVGVGACTIMTIPELQLHFRLHDYYMGMATLHSPLSVTNYINRNVA
jgi:hypothetical protein